jgi:hypothetical protein
MNPGQLSEKVVFEQRNITINANGGSDLSWSEAFTAWAFPERQSEMGCRFTLRFRDGISPQGPLLHRIIWDDTIWVIDSAVHDRKHRYLTLDCSQGNLQEVTALTSIETEYVDGVPIRRPQSD